MIYCYVILLYVSMSVNCLIGIPYLLYIYCVDIQVNYLYPTMNYIYAYNYREVFKLYRKIQLLHIFE